MCNNCLINLNPSVEDFPHYKGGMGTAYGRRHTNLFRIFMPCFWFQEEPSTMAVNEEVVTVFGNSEVQ